MDRAKVNDIRKGYIYRIWHKHSNASYIGQSLDFPTGRWSDHIRKLREGTHNPKFQDVWNSSVVTDWAFEILENVTSSDLLDEREAYWVRKNDAIENGFNATTKIGKQIARNDRIADIVESLERGDTYRSIAKRYGVALGTVTNIKNRYLE